MLGTRVYALVLVSSLATVVAVEAVPREMGRLSDATVTKRLDKLEGTLGDLVARVARGDVAPGDETALAAVRAEVAALRGEARVRDIRTGAFVLLALASLVFALTTAPRVLFRKRAAPRSGTVEIEPDETVHVDPVDAVHAVGRLHPSRKVAVDHLLSQVSLHCMDCGWLWRPSVLGRIGRRLLVRRMPPGSPVSGDVLGEGWWSRPADPPACERCGGKDLLPD